MNLKKEQQTKALLENFILRLNTRFSVIFFSSFKLKRFQNSLIVSYAAGYQPTPLSSVVIFHIKPFPFSSSHLWSCALSKKKKKSTK